MDELEDIRHRRHLNFVWIAPSYRRKGLLINRWSLFVKSHHDQQAANPFASKCDGQITSEFTMMH
jgi:hypothetical protein